MTTPALNRYRAKSLSDSRQTSHWILFVVVANLVGGLGAAIGTFFFGKKDIALGFFIGSLLSTLNLYMLQSLTVKILELGEKGRKRFWFWNIIRWMVLASVCRFLLYISIACLLAAVGSYIWFLVVLGLAEWQSRSPAKTP